MVRLNRKLSGDFNNLEYKLDVIVMEIVYCV